MLLKKKYSSTALPTHNPRATPASIRCMTTIIGNKKTNAWKAATNNAKALLTNDW